MKTIKEIKELLQDLKNEIKQKYNAGIIGIFGSVVRNEQKETSDIDILVDFNEDASLFDLVGLSIFLEEKLGQRVDVVPREDLREEIKESILKEVMYL